MLPMCFFQLRPAYFMFYQSRLRSSTIKFSNLWKIWNNALLLQGRLWGIRVLRVQLFVFLTYLFVIVGMSCYNNLGGPIIYWCFEPCANGPLDFSIVKKMSYYNNSIFSALSCWHGFLHYLAIWFTLMYALHMMCIWMCSNWQLWILQHPMHA